MLFRARKPVSQNVLNASLDDKTQTVTAKIDFAVIHLQTNPNPTRATTRRAHLHLPQISLQFPRVFSAVRAKSGLDRRCRIHTPPLSHTTTTRLFHLPMAPSSQQHGSYAALHNVLDHDSDNDSDTEPHLGRDLHSDPESDTNTPLLPPEPSSSANVLGDTDLERQQPPGLSAKQRALNVAHYFFPFRQTYERLSNGIATGRLQTNTPGRFVGQGTDGVFRNLMAKPDTEANRVVQEQHPPTYEEAAADSAPEYWESTMMGPVYEDEVFVQGLPVGNAANFVWNVLVTVAFQLVGFLLCYLLHTSHAAKHGSRAGLGIYLITFGHSMLPTNVGSPDKIPPRYLPNNPNLYDISLSLSIKQGGRVDTFTLGFQQNLDVAASRASSHMPYLAYGLIVFGGLMVVHAVVAFYRMKQTEKSMLAPQALPETHTHTTTVEATD